jgi:hypothetical protein
VLNVRCKFRAAPAARQSHPNVVPVRMARKRMSGKHIRGESLSRRRFASDRVDRCVGATVSKPSCDQRWSAEGGNVLLVVPMGEEAFRSEQDFVRADMLPLAPCHFRCRSFPCTVELTAPNGLRVAVIELPEVDKEVALVKGAPKTVELGLVTMRIETNNLIAGGRFIAQPRIVAPSLTVGGASPHNWEYTIEARFDGSCLSAEINANSTSLQNRNLATPVHDLGSGEEIVVVIPTGGLKLSSTLDLPSASTKFLGSLCGIVSSQLGLTHALSREIVLLPTW